MKWSLVIFLSIIADEVLSRDGKWFFRKNTVTQFVSEKPATSSCVVLEESLKPCRHLRQLLASPSIPPPKILMTTHPMHLAFPADSLRTSEEEHPTVRSWASFLGVDEVTITRTITQRSFAPPAPITFSVRGCRPSRLPFNLPLCSVNSTTPMISTGHNSPTRAVHFVEE